MDGLGLGERAAELALEIALDEHDIGVVEPPNRVFVTRDGSLYSAEKDSGGKWAKGRYLKDEDVPEKHSRILEYINVGLGWDWVVDYRNRGFQWCGAFCSFLFAETVSPALRKRNFASTYRLHRWAKEDPSIRVAKEDARPGDIAVVGKSMRHGGKSYGDHIVFVVDVTSEGLHTIEGNAYGDNKEGERVEGVVRCFRPFEGSNKKYTVRFVYRMQDSHCEQRDFV